MRRALLALLLFGCQAAPAVGASCARDSECAVPLVCRFGRCRTECAAASDCPAGARCISASGAGVCTLDAENHCDGRVCPSPLTCIADQCRSQCSQRTDCIAGPCVGGTCQEAVSGLDASVPDGSLDANDRDVGPPGDADWPDAYVPGESCIAIQTSVTCDTQLFPDVVTIHVGDSPYLCWFNNIQGGSIASATVRYDSGETSVIPYRDIWTDPTPHCTGTRPYDEVAHVSLTCITTSPFAFDVPIHCP